MASGSFALRAMANNAKDRMKEEMGDEFDEAEWQKLDPRRYDPRRIIREALAEEVVAAPNATILNQPKVQAQQKLVAGEQAPFDAEAT